jgi:hypothetical protein
VSRRRQFVAGDIGEDAADLQLNNRLTIDNLSDLIADKPVTVGKIDIVPRLEISCSAMQKTGRH